MHCRPLETRIKGTGDLFNWIISAHRLESDHHRGRNLLLQHSLEIGDGHPTRGHTASTREQKQPPALCFPQKDEGRQVSSLLAEVWFV